LELQAALRTNGYLYVLQPAGDSVLKTMDAGLYVSGGPVFFSIACNRPTPLKYKPAASVRYQNNYYSIKLYLPDDNFMMPPMRFMAAVREYTLM
jgi:hypothetical protein